MTHVPCTACGHLVGATASACPSCGRPDPARPARSRRRLAVVALVVAALLAVVLVGVQLGRSEAPSEQVQCAGDAGAAGIPVDEACPS